MSALSVAPLLQCSTAPVSRRVPTRVAQIRCSDDYFISSSLAHFPARWQRKLERQYRALAVGGSSYAANVMLRDAVEAAGGNRLRLNAGEFELVEQARQAAVAGYDVCRLSGARGVDSVYSALVQHCASYGVSEPANCGGAVAIAKMLCPSWWLRRLRKSHVQRVEALAVRSRLVSRDCWAYVSDDGLDRRIAAKRRTRQLLDAATITNDVTGESMTLASVVDLTVSNPRLRRLELLTRAAGLERYAAQNGYSAEFLTVTCPSKYHSMRVDESGHSIPNPKYQNYKPGEARDYLQRVWALARSAWQRRELQIFGLRISEPHHDACPHFHILMFGRHQDIRFARRLLRVYAMREDGQESGAAQHRFKSVKIDSAKGSAIGYLVKYVAKNVDGHGVGEDLESGRSAKGSADRVEAWASSWAIRQFQFFGAPSVTLWRELRRQRSPVACPAVEVARSAADSGDFQAFVNAVGGCAIPRRSRLVWLEYRSQDGKTRYGEDKPKVVCGFGSVAGSVAVKKDSWSVNWVSRGLGFASPRIHVNNCTPRIGAGFRGAIDKAGGFGVKSRPLAISRQNL